MYLTIKRVVEKKISGHGSFGPNVLLRKIVQIRRYLFGPLDF